jgi:anti-sigma regulatory factor (Ser/Thr protein kinase)
MTVLQQPRSSKWLAIGVYTLCSTAFVYLMTIESSEYGFVVDATINMSIVLLHLAIMIGANKWMRARAFSPALELLSMMVVASVSLAVFLLLLNAVIPKLFVSPSSPIEPSSFDLVVSSVLNGCQMLGLYLLAIRHPDVLFEKEALRNEAELQSLRARLEPHFMLNTLNAIAAIAKTRPDDTRSALAALGDLLQDTLKGATQKTHTMADEVAWLKSYLMLLQVRYGDELEVRFVVDEQASQAMVPRLLLQPFVENAVLHGVAAALPGFIRISVSRDHGTQVVIENSGPPYDPHKKSADGHGHGLALARRRIELEAPGSTVHIEPTKNGTKVTLHIVGGRANSTVLPHMG